jgi:hypothetical protein
MSIIEVNTDATTLSKIVAYLKSLDVKFKVKDTEDSLYDPEFVERILKAREEKNGDRILTEAYKKELFGSL